MKVSRDDVLRFRVHAQGLDSLAPRGDAAILDLGVQDTGPDGAGWALELRGATAAPDDLVYAWTLRGAPHAYRRADAAAVAGAVAPWSEADAAKRIFDASKPFQDAGIPVLDALEVIAGEMRDIAASPIVKGEMSRELSDRLDPPYLRHCRPCEAIHTYEQPFRLAALQAGLELEPGTSPPVLRRIKGWRGAVRRVPAHLDVVRGVLRFLGPSSPKLVAGYVDSPAKEVAAHWPEDVETVEVDGVALEILADDAAALADPPTITGSRLLGPFDLFLQGRDRELVVPDEPARKDLWRTLGRPGGILDGHEVIGSWRPRSSGKKLRIATQVWTGAELPTDLEDQAERLATFRGQTFDGWA